MKVILGGIIGGILVLSVIILFPAQLEESQEFIQHETMHPCQKAGMDRWELYEKTEKLMSSPNTSIEELQKWAEEFDAKYEQINQVITKSDCNNTQSEWLTEEFRKEVKLLEDKGF